MLYTCFMEKDLRLIGLFGIYGNLLTEHQREIFGLYYECDLSLGEIAEIKGISRQSVNDGLRKARDLLLSTEEKLGLMKKFSAIESIVSRAEKGEIESFEAIKQIKTITEGV